MAGSRVAKGTLVDKSGGLTATMASVQLDTGTSLVVCLAVQNAATVALNTMTWNGVAMTLTIGVSNATVVTYLAYLHNVTGATGDIVATFDVTGPPTAVAMTASMWYGLKSSPNDKNKTGTGSSTTPTTGNTAATTQADEVLLACIATVGTPADAAGTWSSSFTAGQRDGTTGGLDISNATISEGYRIVSATAAYAGAKTGITNREWAAAIGTFKLVTDVAVTLGACTPAATAAAMTPAGTGTATVALGACAPAAVAYAPALVAGAVAVALGLATASCITNPLEVSQSAQPEIVRDADTAAVASASESSTDGIDPWTGTPWTPPVARYLKSGTNAGVRSGTPYFALVQNHDLGTLGASTVPFDAFDSFAGVARFVGRDGSHEWELVFALDALPVQRSDPDEPHWLMSYFESNGSDSEDLLCLGVTPSGRIIMRVRGRLDAMSPVNTVQGDGRFHSVQMTYDYNVPRFTVYLDDLFLMAASYGTAMTTETNRYAALAAGTKIDFPGPRAGYQSRFMLFNGRLGDTHCDVRISRAAVWSTEDPWYWDIPQGGLFTSVPTTGEAPIDGYDLSLDVVHWNPAPSPLLYGPLPVTQPQYGIYRADYTPFVKRDPAAPAYTKLPVPVP